MSTETLTVKPSRADWEQILNDNESRSLSGIVQVSGKTGNRYRLVLSYANLTGADRQAMWGHLMQLKGRRNRLNVPILMLASGLSDIRGGAGGGTPLLVGAHSAGATELSIDGATSVANWLKAGDWITVGNQLASVAQNVTTTGGAGTISIWPELHKNYSDNTAVNITTPSGVFFLRDPGALNMSRYGTGWRDESFVLSLEQDVAA